MPENHSFQPKVPFLFQNKSECCGCSACMAICPQRAITLTTDDMGFTYPIINEEKCTGCLLCQKVCPLKTDFVDVQKNTYKTKAYAVRHLSEEIIRRSSSGGVFTLLSDLAFKNGWGICCCIYDYDLNCTRFKLITSKEQRDDARGSKYIHSHMDDIFQECFRFLQDNREKKLLFIGLGCQVEGFRKYSVTKHICNRVILCDLICHGQASELFWQNQLKMINAEGKRLDAVSFKDKRKGWEYPKAFVNVKSKEYAINYYCNLFYDGYIMRPNCYDCHFTKTERMSDLTIGDFWGVNENYPYLYDKMGVSLVLIHSSIGEEILDSMRDCAQINEVDIHKCLQPRLQNPLGKPHDYDDFWHYFNKNGGMKAMKKYGKEAITAKCIGVVKRVKQFRKMSFAKVEGKAWTGDYSDLTLDKLDSTRNGCFQNGQSYNIKSFMMGKYQVTQEIYKVVIEYANQNGCYKNTSQRCYCPLNSTPSSFYKYKVSKNEISELRPVENINWFDAVFFCNILTIMILGEEHCAYCIENITVTNGHIINADVEWNHHKLGFRLPTEAEWEFAARDGAPEQHYEYPGYKLAKNYSSICEIDKDDELVKYAWFNANSSGNHNIAVKTFNKLTRLLGTREFVLYSKTHEVGLKLPNKHGLYDMSGNVHEWVWDEWKPCVELNIFSLEEPFTRGSRIMRGGGWPNAPYDITVLNRWAMQPAYCPALLGDKNALSDVGFRICCNLSGDDMNSDGRHLYSQDKMVTS